MVCGKELIKRKCHNHLKTTMVSQKFTERLKGDGRTDFLNCDLRLINCNLILINCDLR